MQLAITLPKFLLLNEQRVIQQRDSIEDIEFEFLSKDECIVHECVQTDLESWLVFWLLERDFCGVVEKIGGADFGVLYVLDDGGFENVEGEKVSDFLA